MTRLIPRERRASILSAALDVACEHGYNRVTREQIATAANCSPALVSHVFGTVADLRRAIMGEAIRRVKLTNNDDTAALTIVAQGLAAGDTRARNLPEDVRARVVNYLMG